MCNAQKATDRNFLDDKYTLLVVNDPLSCNNVGGKVAFLHPSKVMFGKKLIKLNFLPEKNPVRILLSYKGNIILIVLS